MKRDQITSKTVHGLVRAHDRYARNNRADWALYKQTYMTKYWDHINGETKGNDRKRLREVEVEVNRLWGVITSYLSALYPRASRVILGPDSAGQGDPAKGELVLNRWFSSRKIHQRVMTALRQAILYPGSGVKVGYSHGRGSALDRVWLRVIPVWEMLLDTEVSDADDERYRGHLYYRPKAEVEEEYGLDDISGTRREDFLSRVNGHSREDKNRNRYESDDDADFVRVLEFCNLVDHYVDPENPSLRYEGRLEIYVLGQGNDSKKPVYVGPLPFARHDGEPLAHILPLIFNYEPEFPLRGISHVRRLMPQFKELNAYRSYMAMATRKDTRQYVTRKGTFGSDELTLLTEGHDGLVLEVESGYERPLNDAIIPILNAPVSSNIHNYVNDVENDIERVIGTSPASRGMVTKATAFEIETVQQYTESEFGLHAAIKDQWLSSLTELVLRALISTMQDTGDSSGAFEDTKVDIAEVGASPQEGGGEDHDAESEVFDIARIKELAEMAGVDVESNDFKDLASQITKKRELDDMTPEELQLLGSSLSGRALDEKSAKDAKEEEQVDMALLKSTSSKQEPMVDEDVVPPLGPDDSGSVNQEVIMLRDRDEQIAVTVEDLDANFEIFFVEGGRTPLSDAAMQQNLVALLQPYGQLWDVAQKGGAGGSFARSYMKVLAERFDLPKDLHPDELDARTSEEEEKANESKKSKSKKPQDSKEAQPVEPQTQGPEQSAAPPDQAAADPAAQEQEIEQMMAQVAQMPPDQALAALKEIFSDQPELMQMLAQIEALPPEQQGPAIQQLLGASGANV